MKNVYRTLTAVLLITASSFTQAAIVANGDFTTDTDTMLDWLDLDLTLGLSLNHVIAQTASGGTFEGWQVATLNQVYTYLTNLGWVGAFDPANEMNIDFVASFKSQTTSLLNDPAGDLGALSLTNDPLDTFGNNHYLDDFASGLGNNRFTQYTSSYPVDPSVGQQEVGTYLVRTSAVPIPAAVWLFCSGLVLLIGSARRRG